MPTDNDKISTPSPVGGQTTGRSGTARSGETSPGRRASWWNERRVSGANGFGLGLVVGGGSVLASLPGFTPRALPVLAIAFSLLFYWAWARFAA